MLNRHKKTPQPIRMESCSFNLLMIISKYNHSVFALKKTLIRIAIIAKNSAIIPTVSATFPVIGPMLKWVILNNTPKPTKNSPNKRISRIKFFFMGF